MIEKATSSILMKLATNLSPANQVLFLRSLFSSHLHGSSLRGRRRILTFITNFDGASTVRIDVMGSSRPIDRLDSSADNQLFIFRVVLRLMDRATAVVAVPM